MTNPANLYQGISKCAWGYFFLYFDFNFGSVSILPDFVAFWLFLSAIDLMKEEERELVLLKPLGMILMVWNGVQWLLDWYALDLSGYIPGSDTVICLVNLYFHFQLMTNLASIARVWQSEGARHDEKLLKYRSIQVVLFTVTMVLLHLSNSLGAFWGSLSLAMAVPYLIAGVCLMSVLLAFRRDLADACPLNPA